MIIYQILMTKYHRKFTNDYQISTNSYVRIYKQIMQNKPNSPNVQMNLTIFTSRNYAISNCLTKVKNKPNSKPIQTQTNPILANYKAWQSQNKAKTNPIQKMNAFAPIRHFFRSHRAAYSVIISSYAVSIS